MKKVAVIALSLMTIIALNSCGGNANNNAENEDTTAQTQEPATQTQPMDESQDQGVGKYKDVKLGPIDQDLANKGKSVFEQKCALCHKTTDEKYVGPGLKGITNQRQPAWILNMVTNPDLMLDKDPVAKDLLAQFNGTRMANQNLTDEQAHQVLEYLRKNDQQNQ